MEKIKKITALFLSLALLLALLPSTAWATEAEELPEETAVTEDAAEETDEAQETAPESSVSVETEDDAASQTEEADEETLAESIYSALFGTATIAETSSGSCGENLTWELDDSGTLTISGTGAMEEWEYYSESGSPWYDCSSDIKSVVIEEGVTNISSGAFEDCYNLISVTIANSVTSIGEQAFLYCESLTSITIGNSVTSIGGYAFCCCTSLSSVTIPASVTSIGEGAFDSCDFLEMVYYGGTQSDWSAISIGSYNDYLTQAIIYFADGTTGGGKVCGDNLTWSLDDDGTLTISGTGAMWDFSYDSVEDYYDEETDETYYTLETDIPWYGRYFTSVVIEDGV
ncbi:MAG: leucine-rich repeat domain-containing protein, partial [Clostridiales bacterium]|nr:leucine-rich repeat domain-containing protein [Clostridiales bacterium]